MSRFPYFLSLSPPKPTWLLSLEFLSLQRDLDAQHSLRHVLVCIQILSLNEVAFSSPNRKFMGTLLGADSKVPKVRQDFLPCLRGLISSQTSLYHIFKFFILSQEPTGTLMDKVLVYGSPTDTNTTSMSLIFTIRSRVTYVRPVCRYDHFF